MLTSVTEIFCAIDDFCKYFEESYNRYLIDNPHRKRNRTCSMSLSEIMTITILFHLSDYRTFKSFYINCLKRELNSYFPNSVSYNRFVELIPSGLVPLTVFLSGIKGRETGLYFADSTSIEVCHNKRERRHRVFKDIATKGKNSMGWFFGLKLHLVINNLGEIMACTITKANTDDRVPLPKMLQKLKGWLFADKGYLGMPLIKKLQAQAIQIFTKVRKTMKARIMTPTQQFFLGKRGIIETVIDQLKNSCQIEHTRHRSPANAMVNIISGVIAYCFRDRKPSIRLNKIDMKNMTLISN